ncbi:23S rRNA pseudouridine1911/1915/1917 synthase [Eubacterium oxidoreducens]|uniref:Pseudouridine synthase n=2 Tax=Eubacterium oxidoreducens TaxID=1732 RepID=A0A1G6AQE8_EUBOX|nr:RluA family pseudouridine synthase [Eubacterium oxidoreducens]SDB10634.1 23S rRNA pseudouridine1911/1915/1917 synthase [Eubacterium oxidoreducens]
MKRTLIYKIEEKFNNMTIEQFIRSKGFSHKVIVALKKTPNGIVKNNIWAYTRESVSTGDILTLTLNEEESSDKIIPIKLPLDIVYEDDDLLVINKPSGMPTHPSYKNYDNTLANAVAYYYQQQNQSFVFRCINRLDRDTTGLTIIAKNPFSASVLYNAAKNRRLHRTYEALVCGRLEGEGVIDAPISREVHSTITRCVDTKNGERAVTHYRSLAYHSDKDLSYIALQLETGRTHQIRVHMKHIGHPLPGDYLYHPDYTYINRVALHSSGLEFDHPITQKHLKFYCPIPQDMNII